MSEYQYVGFRAADRPVSAENLEYMKAQSSRAEITVWSFDNKYHYGDFHGNAEEMLRRGYDIHLHYANFGIRKLLLRLPEGLPDSETARPYFSKDTLRLIEDKKGRGAVLQVNPYHEPGDLDELYDADKLIDGLVPLLAEILDGDLRPLYLAHLAMCCDGEHVPEKTSEAAVPAGLNELTDAQNALAGLYDLGDDLIAAAAMTSPPIPNKHDANSQVVNWLRDQPQMSKDNWITELVTDPSSNVRGDVLSAFRKSCPTPAWPTAKSNRTIAELLNAAESIREENARRDAVKTARARAKRLADMAKDPERYLRETKELVKQRSQRAYEKTAELLAELREALVGTSRAGLAEQHAQTLRGENSTLNRLVKELRNAGLLEKR